MTTMEYPKQIMSKKELLDMGFTRAYLDRVSTTKGQTVAFRLNPNNPRSTLLFDTRGLEKFRLSEIKAAERAMELRTSVI